MQRPPRHRFFLPHLLPQEPQFALLRLRLTQTPAHNVSGAAQVGPIGAQVLPVHCSFAVQMSHVSPPSPQPAFVLPSRQSLAASQQPFGQLSGVQFGVVQTLLAQVCVDGHIAHATPPVPHCAFKLPSWHWPLLSQQPFGQVVALQLPNTQTAVWFGWVTHVVPAAQT